MSEKLPEDDSIAVGETAVATDNCRGSTALEVDEFISNMKTLFRIK